MARRRSNALRIVMDALETTIARVAVTTALDIQANLVAAPSEGGTPVDTGWARANWILSIGTPISAPVGTRDAVTLGPQAAGIALVATGYRTSMGSIYLSNNVPYIVFLNAGSSKQAPAQFVERAILNALRQQRERRR